MTSQHQVKLKRQLSLPRQRRKKLAAAAGEEQRLEAGYTTGYETDAEEEA